MDNIRLDIAGHDFSAVLFTGALIALYFHMAQIVD